MTVDDVMCRGAAGPVIIPRQCFVAGKVTVGLASCDHAVISGREWCHQPS